MILAITVNSTYDWNLFAFFITLVPIILYAEIHYRLPFFSGFLYKKQPEIIFDTPFRIQTSDLPIILFIKDANRFPIHLTSVRIVIKSPVNGEILNEYQYREEIDITDRWFVKFYPIDAAKYKDEELQVECQAMIRIGKKSATITNDNYRTVSHADFKVYIDSEPLPAPNGWIWGDLHCHSSWTEDQVEFGFPAENIEQMALSMGISFCGLVEHSYDLDDMDGSWTNKDPNIHKWNFSRQGIGQLNSNTDRFLIIPGEEISTDNGLGKNVHMIVLNDDQYYPGDGDALEKSIAKTSELYYGKILDRIPEKAFAFAAHPYADPPFFHKLGLKRYLWNHMDSHARLSGLQFMNGIIDGEFKIGKHEWIRQLLRGKRVYVYAGNDSHGNFNRYRQIFLPMILLNEKSTQIFGEHRTGVFASLFGGVDQLTDRLKNGQVIVTNGPFINLVANDQKDDNFYIGDVSVSPLSRATISAISSRYFGNLKKIRLIVGDIDNQQEWIYKTIESLSAFTRKSLTVPLENLPRRGYLRTEVTTQKDKFAITNPIRFGNF